MPYDANTLNKPLKTKIGIAGKILPDIFRQS